MIQNLRLLNPVVKNTSEQVFKAAKNSLSTTIPIRDIRSLTREQRGMMLLELKHQIEGKKEFNTSLVFVKNILLSLYRVDAEQATEVDNIKFRPQLITESKLEQLKEKVLQKNETLTLSETAHLMTTVELTTNKELKNQINNLFLKINQKISSEQSPVVDLQSSFDNETQTDESTTSLEKKSSNFDIVHAKAKAQYDLVIEELKHKIEDGKISVLGDITPEKAIVSPDQASGKIRKNEKVIENQYSKSSPVKRSISLPPSKSQDYEASDFSIQYRTNHPLKFTKQNPQQAVPRQQIRFPNRNSSFEVTANKTASLIPRERYQTVDKRERDNSDVRRTDSNNTRIDREEAALKRRDENQNQTDRYELPKVGSDKSFITTEKVNR